MTTKRNNPHKKNTVFGKLLAAGGFWHLRWWITFAAIIKPWLPTVFAVLVLAVVLLALYRDAIPQITDIVNPSSAGEVQRDVQHYGRAFWLYLLILCCVVAVPVLLGFLSKKRGPRLAHDLRAWLSGLVASTIVCIGLLVFKPSLPVDWVMGVWFSLGAWLLGVTVLAWANYLQYRKEDAGKRSLILTPRGLLPLDRWLRRRSGRRLPFFRTRERRFVLLLVFIFLLTSLPAWSTIVYLQLQHGPEDSLDMHHLSFVCLLSLISMLSLMTGLWQLAKHEHLAWPVPLLPWLPAWVLFLGFFSVYWPDTGKGLSGVEPSPVANPATGYLFLGNGDPTGIRRTDHAKPTDPLVLISVAGGGSRAALFTAGIFSRMWWDTDRDGRHPGRDLLTQADAVSSVSGGSLASAYLQEYMYRWMINHGCGPAKFTATVQNDTLGMPPTVITGALQIRQAALKDFFEQQRFGSLTSEELKRIGATRTFPTFKGETPSASLEETMSQKQKPWSSPWEGRLSQKAAVQAFDSAPYFNAMREDHVAATVAGFFQPWYGRGPNLEDFWSQSFGWGRGAASTRLSEFRPFEQAGLMPALMLDSTITNSGTRLVITNVDQTCFAQTDKFGYAASVMDLGDNDSPSNDQAAQRRRYDPLPFQINTLASLTGWDIPLVTAVRASANVPFAYPTIRFHRTTAGKGDPLLELTDGGVLDNTAVDATMALVRSGGPVLVPPPSGPTRVRGVHPILIFQIDSGELPKDPAPHWWDQADHYLEEPQRAGWRTNLNLQADVHSLYIEELCRIYGFRERGPDSPVKAVRMWIKDRYGNPSRYTLGFVSPGFAFFRVRAGELLGDHVTTTWHLPVTERYRLYGVTMAPQQGETIRAAAAWMRDPAAFTLRKKLDDVSIEPVY